ncbi:U-box domain-containing protein 52-like [Impatiens glandulifera]|uniref:U-box domain-containing protein 52-like n=1 Tax=Impatiens glandulifera TaxID=253017 RepID=UPI001FB14AFC|nr:U-box domain-containing protein 52-like [Impatiens glandulifera]
MWGNHRSGGGGGSGGGGEKKETITRLVALAIDKDKGSQTALKWVIDNMLSQGQTLVLIHVDINKSHSQVHLSHSPPKIHHHEYSHDASSSQSDADPITKELFLPFRCYCTRKDIKCYDIVLHEHDVAKALVDYVSQSAIEVLVLGAPSKHGFLKRFKITDVPSSVTKVAADFCTVYVISSKGKISSTRAATRAAPAVSQLRNLILAQNIPSLPHSTSSHAPSINAFKGIPRSQSEHPTNMLHDLESMKSPFTHRKGPNGKSYADFPPPPDTDISFVSGGRPSIDNMHPPFYDGHDVGRAHSPFQPSILDAERDRDSYRDRDSFEYLNSGRKSIEAITPRKFSITSDDSERSSSTQAMDEVEVEMRRLKQQLKQTMDMYSSACKEALTAKQKTNELQRWKVEEEQKLEEAKLSEGAALALVEKERAKSRVAIEHAEASQRIAELEAQKRISVEMKALKEAEERNKVMSKLSESDIRYRRYSIEDIESSTNFFHESLKIGEGGYGPVYKCYLDHTPTAVKVLRPDAAQGRSQFQREVEVLSCIRHPNMVLLLGACPEYGCLVYEYMSNGSLEDRLLRKGNTPPLTWQQRFRIACEIGTGLLFLHQAKPEPIVHRDLKPGNILLDHNYVSKISDVGLARLVPPSVADTVTQYRMTSTAGTFCYIDPEYQQTGMLGIKSDIYSLGIMFLQIITAKPPMGLAHHVEKALEKGTFAQMLDPTVTNWPIEEALLFGRMSLQCAELRRKDRPDLGKVVLPELERMRNMADEQTMSYSSSHDGYNSRNQSQASISNEGVSPFARSGGYESSRSHMSTDNY